MLPDTRRHLRLLPRQRSRKPTGNDLREGKITLPLLHVLLDNNAPDHDAMVQLAYKDRLDTDEIDRLVKYAVDNGGIQYARAAMEDMRDRAAKLLDTFADTQARHQLLDLFDFILDRKS